MKEHNQQYYRKNQEKERQRSKHWHQDNKTRKATYDKERHELNKEEINRKKREYYQAHKEQRREYDKKRYKENKDYYQKYSKDYRQRKRAQIKAYQTVSQALRSKELLKLPCEFCRNTESLEFHHYNGYKDNELVGVWVCSSCHKRLHSGNLEI